MCTYVGNDFLHPFEQALVVQHRLADDDAVTPKLTSLSYQPGRANSNDDLEQHLSRAMNDFSLTATFGWTRANAIAAQ